MKKTNKKIIFLFSISLGIFIISGCNKVLGDQSEKATVKNPQEKQEEAGNTTGENNEAQNIKDFEISPKTDMVKEFEIISKQWVFEPSIITVKKGDKVKLKIKSIDVPYGFAVPIGSFKTDKRIIPRETVEYEFTADEIREFPYYCTVGCGRGHFDMEGKIIVTE